MSLETAQFIHQLNPSNPSGADRLKEGDDHIRLLKAALKNTFPGLTGPLDASVTNEFLNGLAASLVPAGAIMLWQGVPATVPTGWAICDGREVPKSDGSGTITTPNLAGRVPVGVSSDHALLSTFGAESQTVTTEVAGSHTHEASAAEAGAHTHTVSGKTGSAKTGVTVDAAANTKVDAGSSATNVPRLPFTTNDPGHEHRLDATAASAGAHTHTVTVKQVDGHAHKVTSSTLQPSLTLYFIIKV